jgi:extradiol dioxygenase family protein
VIRQQVRDDVGLPPEDDARGRLVVRTTGFDEAHQTMQRVVLPMEPLSALNMRLDSTRVDHMMMSMVRFGGDIGLLGRGR